jgi:hypothetical protein
VAVRWRQDVGGNIKSADDKWPNLKDKDPSELLKK